MLCVHLSPREPKQKYGLRRAKSPEIGIEIEIEIRYLGPEENKKKTDANPKQNNNRTKSAHKINVCKFYTAQRPKMGQAQGSIVFTFL